MISGISCVAGSREQFRPLSWVTHFFLSFQNTASHITSKPRHEGIMSVMARAGALLVLQYHQDRVVVRLNGSFRRRCVTSTKEIYQIASKKGSKHARPSKETSTAIVRRHEVMRWICGINERTHRGKVDGMNHQVRPIAKEAKPSKRSFHSIRVSRTRARRRS